MAKRRQGETSYKQTAFGIIPRSKLIELEIEGTKRVWDFLLRQRVKQTIPVTSASLKQLYDIGFGWIFPETKNTFRTIEVEVSNHRPPKFYRVPELIHNFCEDFRVRYCHLPYIKEETALEEIVAFIAWAHHRFLWIHPFADYNGRIGRLLISIILLNLNLPPVELKAETTSGRKHYIHALQEADQGNYAQLQNFIMEAVRESAERARNEMF